MSWLGDFLLRRAVLQLQGKLAQDAASDKSPFQDVALADLENAVGHAGLAQQQVKAAAAPRKAASGLDIKGRRVGAKASVLTKKKQEAVQNALNRQAVRTVFTELQDTMKKLDATNSSLVKDAARKEVTYQKLRDDGADGKQVEIALKDARSARAHVLKLYGVVGTNIMSLRTMLCDLKQLASETDMAVSDLHQQTMSEEERVAVQVAASEFGESLATLNVAIGLSADSCDCLANPVSRVDDATIAERFDALNRTLAMEPEVVEQVRKASLFGVFVSSIIARAGKALRFIADHLFVMITIYAVASAGLTLGLPAALLAGFESAARYGFAQTIRWFLTTMRSNDVLRKAILATRDAIVAGLVRMAVPEQYAKNIVGLAANPLVVGIVVQSTAAALAGNLSAALSNVSVGAKRVDDICDVVNTLKQSPFRSADEVTEFVRASGNEDLISSAATVLGKPPSMLVDYRAAAQPVAVAAVDAEAAEMVRHIAAEATDAAADMSAELSGAWIASALKSNATAVAQEAQSQTAVFQEVMLSSFTDVVDAAAETAATAPQTAASYAAYAKTYLSNTLMGLVGFAGVGVGHMLLTAKTVIGAGSGI